MANTTTEFEIQFEGDTIPVIITEIEEADEVKYMVTLSGKPDFEIFLSEEDMWVTNDDVDLEEDFIFTIGDKFESLQP